MGKNTLGHVAESKLRKVRSSSVQGNLIRAHLEAGRGTSLVIVTMLTASVLVVSSNKVIRKDIVPRGLILKLTTKYYSLKGQFYLSKLNRLIVMGNKLKP